MTRIATNLVTFSFCLIMSAAQSTFAEDVSLARIGTNVIDAATLRELLPPLDAAQRRAVAAVCQVPDTYPSEPELQAFYQANQRAFMEPPRYRLAQLFVSVPAADPAATANAQAKLDPVLAALAEPDADFADLVRRFSDEKDSASRGGEVGWLAESQLRPELRPLLADLKAGQVSRPVRLADGWHIVKCLELRPESPVPFADIRSALADRMRAERTAANRQAYLARLLQDNPISLNELALRDLLATAP